jgi:hypothetical protein
VLVCVNIEASGVCHDTAYRRGWAPSSVTQALFLMHIKADVGAPHMARNMLIMLI